MGEHNNVMYRYLKDNTRFADLFNGVCFGGRQVVRAGQLSDASEKYIETSGQNPRTRERLRDIRKQMRSGETLRVLALEMQDRVDYTMPWRCMNYDSLEYEQQIREIQAGHERENGRKPFLFYPSDRLQPIYTLCLYHGEGTWDGPRSLRDMMDFGDAGARPGKWERIFSDYTLKLVSVNELADYSVFHTSLKQLFQVLALRADKKGLQRLMNSDKVFRHLDGATAETIAVMTNNTFILENMAKYQEEGGCNMCKALEDLKEEGREEGREEGELTALVKLVCRKIVKGKTVEEIAGDLDEDSGKIRRIYDTAVRHAPNYDLEKILKELIQG